MRRLTALATAAATLATLGLTALGGPGAPSAYAVPGVRATDGCVRSVPEPGTTEPVDICFTVFRPAGAGARHRVPMILSSHGWGGSRTTDPAAVSAFTDAGYGVLSFDQRGWGDSGGHAHVEAPAFEGHDVRRLVRRVSRMRWVQQDRKGDPRLGAIGGSYGGGYQFLGAFESLRTKGRPVFDALAPQITWNDLSSSLAPEGVVRTEWALLLSAASVPDDALPPNVYKALLEGAALGEWPDGSVPGTEDMVSFMERNGPAWHVSKGRRLDIPVLFGQGTTDGLFPLQEGLENWRTALTPRARRDSIFVGYNGGHVLPAVLPMGVSITSDPCSAALAGGDFEQLTIRFFDEQLRGRRTGLGGYGRLHVATPTDGCLTTRSERPNHSVEIGTVATSAAAGVPVGTLVAEGPVTVAGSAYLTADVTSVGVENRAFYGLAIGTSPLNARLVQNNVLPLREPLPVAGERRRIPLPAVGVDVPAGQNLYLLASPFSETFVGMGSRTPGAILLEDTVVHLRRTLLERP
ncbi:X-Pro dipeptidyl-peptidase (S15 family) [Nocardioides dokdonensis FR1436]|uniref:X-Pro dipeptidyl-peptidase (S15 family) n=1 Tax=Nocardioides dokdonensis FR1436 TaxID=1300347 RepID=A0A1A9GEU3_9ACTN|nr:CocE/NonD family hydrolase [Nocardioides dokdonensis]ANH36859.1 X-Pro dipeptidyl-peptidase (S15 family) [Nocardioides dokdonensis FR1436]